MSCSAQNSLPVFKNTGNPLIKNKFTADPAPMVHNGRLYLYVGHDEYRDGQRYGLGRTRSLTLPNGFVIQQTICKTGRTTDRF